MASNAAEEATDKFENTFDEDCVDVKVLASASPKVRDLSSNYSVICGLVNSSHHQGLQIIMFDI